MLAAAVAAAAVVVAAVAVAVAAVVVAVVVVVAAAAAAAVVAAGHCQTTVAGFRGGNRRKTYLDSVIGCAGSGIARLHAHAFHILL